MVYSRKSSTSTKIDYSSLHKVARFGSFESLKCMVESGRFFIDCKDESGRTPLELLVLSLLDKLPVKDMLNTTEIEKRIKFLLKYGADPSKGQYSSIIGDSFGSGNKTLINMMINFMVKINAPLGLEKESVLHMAVHKNYYKTAKKLLRMGADPNFQDYQGETPLHIAAFLHRPNMVHLLVKNGGNMLSRNNVINETPLHRACYFGDAEKTVLKFFELGADVNAKDECSCTPLLRLLRGNLQGIDVTRKLVEAFLDHGFYLESKDMYGRSVLESSILYGADPATLQLLRNGALLDISCKKSPFLLQCMYQGRPLSRSVLKFVALKMSEGVDINIEFVYHLMKREGVSLYLEACCKEISSLKSKKINNTTLNYWKLLTKSSRQIAICLNNESVRLDVANFNLSHFPIYGEDLSYKFQKGSKVQNLYSVGADNLKQITLGRLPDIPIRKILDFLAISDLEIVRYFE